MDDDITNIQLINLMLLSQREPTDPDIIKAMEEVEEILDDEEEYSDDEE